MGPEIADRRLAIGDSRLAVRVLVQESGAKLKSKIANRQSPIANPQSPFDRATVKKYRFEATIEEGRGGGALVRVPLDVEKEFGTRGQVKVKATFDRARYRGSIVPTGGSHVLGIRKAIREAIGKGIGETVKVVLERDTDERTVVIPAELAEALDGNTAARERYENLSFTHRRECAEWVAGAKKPETRQRRIQKTIEHLMA